MNSCLYECRVMHHRFAPKKHRFAYRLFLCAIDLDELEPLHRQLRLFSVNRRNLYSFREQDYLPVHEHAHHATSSRNTSTSARLAAAAPAAPTLKQRVLAYLAAHDIALDDGRVMLVTLPRVLGYLFNPVSFYFCYDRAGRPVASIAEVTNTFGEVKPYLITDTAQRGTTFHRRTPKHFYVSPFSDVDVAFDFMLRPPDRRLALQIDDYEGSTRLLTSMLTGLRRPLTDDSLIRATVLHPLVTLRIITLIHWQALQLWLKRLPWFRKAARPEDQRDLHRPHDSLVSSLPP